MGDANKRREQLKETWERATSCTLCPQLAENRNQVVFGAGNANADLMFIGEAPGETEDREGIPFVGRAGQLLDKLLAEIELDRKDIFIANVLKCRPPQNRDPLQMEIENCKQYLFEQLKLIQPVVVCTLGNFATKLLRGDASTGISKLHGQAETVSLGPRTVRLYPIYHPAVALYSPSMLTVMQEDFARIPDLIKSGPPAQTSGIAPTAKIGEKNLPTDESGAAEEGKSGSQMGLF